MNAALPVTLAALLALPVIATPAMAQDLPAISLSYDMGVGAKMLPKYEGSDEDDTKPWVIFRNFDVVLGSRNRGDAETPQGFSFGPSFVLVGKRETGPDAFAPLRGLDPIDRGLEAGMRIGWRTGPVRIYGAARKAIRGHRGVTGEVGVAVTARPAEDWTLTSAIEAQYGDRTFMEAYFGVSPEEAERSGYAEHAVGGGVKAHALTFEARYRVTDDWSMLGRVQAKRLVGDAADSPVVRDRDQVWVGLGVVRSFNFRF